MSINALMQNSRQNVNSIIGNFRNDVYFVDDSFQRRLVWTEKQKVRLIETVLMGYPIPEIYLSQQSPDVNTGHQRFSIVDGQQRITSLVQFISNEWPLKSQYLDKENAHSDYANYFWQDIPDHRKRNFWEYTLSLRIISTDITSDEIRRVFKRLNETDRSLNPQEIRHAEFNGKFIETAKRIANGPFWRNWSVFRDSQIRRMSDIDFATSLLIFIRNGIVSDNPQIINETYDLFNDRYEYSEKDSLKINHLLDIISEIFSHDKIVSNFFSKTVHLFTLFTVLDRKDSDLSDLRLTSIKLRNFIDNYRSDSGEEVYEKYRRGAVQRTRSKGSRDLRTSALEDFLKSRG